MLPQTEVMKHAQHVTVNMRWHGTHQNGKMNILGSAPWPELFWDAFGLDPGRVYRKWLEIIGGWTWGQTWRKAKKECRWPVILGCRFSAAGSVWEWGRNKCRPRSGTRCFQVNDNRAAQCLPSKMFQKVSFQSVFLCHSVLTNPLQLK